MNDFSRSILQSVHCYLLWDILNRRRPTSYWPITIRFRVCKQTFPFQSQDLNRNSSYCLPLIVNNISSENLVFNQVILLELIFFLVYLSASHMHWIYIAQSNCLSHSQEKKRMKSQLNYHFCLQFSFLTPHWLSPWNTITLHKYFWCSKLSEFHDNLSGI